MTDSLVVAQLARRLAEFEERLSAAERGSQLAHSSIEAGTLEVYDEAGQSVLQMGRQEDGTYAVVGANGGKVVADTVPQSVIDEITEQLELADGAVTEAKLAAGAVTETKIADNAVTTPKVVAGAIQTLHLAAEAVSADKLAAQAVTAGKIAALAVTADTLAANAVTADKIAAGAITTDKLTVSGQQALASRVYDACGDLTDWQGTLVAGSITVAQVADSVTGGTVFRAVGAVNGLVRLPLIPFDPTALYRIKARVRQTVAPTGDTTASRFYLGFAAVAGDASTYINTSGGLGPEPTSSHYVGAQAVTLVAGAGWQEFTGYLRGTGTTGTSNARPDPNNPGVAVAGTRYLRPVLYLNYPGGNGVAELDLVAVDVLADGAVGAVSIADGAITADKLSATAINGKVITGSTFYTRSAAPRVEMGETVYEGGAIASIKWDLLGRGWDEPVIQANAIGGGRRRFTIRGPAATSGAAGTSLVSDDADYSWRMTCWTDPVTAISTFTFAPTGGLDIRVPRSAGARHLTFNEGFELYSDQAGAGRLWVNGPDAGECVIGPRGGSAFFSSIRLRTNATTGSAANAFIDSGTQQIRRSTSSLRYKTNVEDLTLDVGKLRALRPVRFRDKGEVEERGDEARWYAGLIAEEVHALGLAELVTYLDGEPDGVQYERVSAALLLLIRDQDRQIAELTERLAGIERRLDGA